MFCSSFCTVNITIKSYRFFFFTGNCKLFKTGSGVLFKITMGNSLYEGIFNLSIFSLFTSSIIRAVPEIIFFNTGALYFFISDAHQHAYIQTPAGQFAKHRKFRKLFSASVIFDKRLQEKTQCLYWPRLHIQFNVFKGDISTAVPWQTSNRRWKDIVRVKYSSAVFGRIIHGDMLCVNSPKTVGRPADILIMDLP